MKPYLTRDPFAGTRVIVAPARASRPNALGDREDGERCPFCPGHESDTPPEIEHVAAEDGHWLVRVFPNLYPATSDDGSAAGLHEVIVETREHDIHPAEISTEGYESMFAVYSRRMRSALERGNATATLFKNEGLAAGESIPHPHSQLIALKELVGATTEGECRFCSVERYGSVIAASGNVVAIVPQSARLPYEIVIATAAHAESGIAAIDDFSEISQLARRAVRSAVAITKHRDFNWFSQFSNASAHAVLTIVPRIAAIAGFELATNITINMIDHDTASTAYRAQFESNGG